METGYRTQGSGTRITRISLRASPPATTRQVAGCLLYHDTPKAYRSSVFWILTPVFYDILLSAEPFPSDLALRTRFLKPNKQAKALRIAGFKGLA